MLYTPLTKEAMRFCAEAHADQLDKSGLPYTTHPFHLAEQMSTEPETCAALLHDVMEDCGKTEDDLRRIGMPECVVEALKLLTHNENVQYLDYVRGIQAAKERSDRAKYNSNGSKIDEAHEAAAMIAHKVKLADLRHNSQLARLDTVTQRDIERLKKYQEARVILGDMAYSLETPAGLFSVQADGKPYPFVLSRKSNDLFLEPAEQATNPGRMRHCGYADETYDISINTLPLQPGSIVKAGFDTDNAIIRYGSGEGLRYVIYEADGYAIGMSSRTHLEGTEEQVCAYENEDDGEYHIVEDPLAHRFMPYQHLISLRVTWRKGTDDETFDFSDFSAFSHHL